VTITGVGAGLVTIRVQLLALFDRLSCTRLSHHFLGRCFCGVCAVGWPQGLSGTRVLRMIRSIGRVGSGQGPLGSPLMESDGIRGPLETSKSPWVPGWVFVLVLGVGTKREGGYARLVAKGFGK